MDIEWKRNMVYFLTVSKLHTSDFIVDFKVLSPLIMDSGGWTIGHSQQLLFIIKLSSVSKFTKQKQERAGN